MQHIAPIVTNPSMLGQANSLVVTEQRKSLIEAQIVRMAIATHTPVPKVDRMLLLVEDACAQWKKIPDEALGEVVTQALCGTDFMPSNGRVAGAWEKMTAPKAIELGMGRRDGDAVLASHAAEEARWQALTPEQREAERKEWSAFWRSLWRGLGGSR